MEFPAITWPFGWTLQKASYISYQKMLQYNLQPNIYISLIHVWSHATMTFSINGLWSRTFFLMLNSISAPWLSKAQQAEYEAINHISVEAKCFAESHCCKIKAGAVLWCPQVSWCISHILYWKGLQKKTLSGHIGSSVLCSWEKSGLNHELINLHL